MFWGLIMEPNKRYTQVVDKAFHVSMASLDTKGKIADTPVQVMLCYEERKYVICNLIKNICPQVPLDLNFDAGAKITFITNGNSSVHLTGYHIPDMDSDEDFDEEDVEEVMNELSKKRKSSSPGDRPGKKGRTELPQQNDADEDDDDDDESEDEDFSMNDINEEADEEVSDEDVDEEEEDDEDDEDEEEDDEDDDDSENETEKKEQKVEQKPAQKDKKNKNKNKPEKQMNGNATAAEKSMEQPKSLKKTIEGGVQVEDIKVGNGPVAKKGQLVSVYYVGRLKNGKKFDSVNSGKGFKFRLGRSEVIKGWDIGINGMKVGGKRRLTIPSALGYGAKGNPPVIPGNSTLIFEVELKNVN